ncbi:ferric reductase like transmembrane component [Aureobasidium pullulans]|uniref:ferric-chelate reductase (NADPH) n=1 Tax=Aureobasidium pullulans TaxID=5580 RepID=A0A4S8ZJF0_AURPU|nr:ferric reductase like transmembrane component [Aureobasidium pullulans]THW66128.1 ferric reductase like transmembrane component [Aureobasidium pullulans]
MSSINTPLLFAVLATAVSAYSPSMTPEQKALLYDSYYQNHRIQWYLGYVWAATVAAIFTYRITVTGLRYVRTLACLENEKQHYFVNPHPGWAALRRNIIDAPLFRRRHNREFKLSAAASMGTLPGRLQTTYLIGYLAMNIAFCVVSIHWGGGNVATEIRNRTGVLSVMNMLPLFLLAGRNNPLIKLLDISFDTYNLMHRWIGRIVVLEAVAHTAAWMASKIMAAPSSSVGWNIIGKAMASSQLILTGTIATSAFIMLLLHSPSVVRHAFYETFLHVHIVLAIIAIVTVWIHLKTLPQQVLILGVIVIWVFERTARVAILIRHNVGRGGTKAEVEALAGEAIRVTLRMARPWKFRAGQHLYLYLPSVGMWTSHPFTIAWSQEEQDLTSEKLPTDTLDVLARRKTTMSLIIRRRTGFTDSLWKKAENAPDGRFFTNALVEGPYGAADSYESYGHVMLFAAGVGITHAVPHARQLVGGYANNTCATRKVVLVWILQSPEHLEWIRPWMTEILAMEKRRDCLRILLFVTRPKSTKEIHSPSASVQMFPGKPDVGALISAEQAKQVGAMAVSVCGTGGLGDDVRRAVRERCEKTTIDFYEESFTW